MDNSITDVINDIKDKKSKGKLIELFIEREKCKNFLEKHNVYKNTTNICPIEREATDFINEIEKKYIEEIVCYNIAKGNITATNTNKLKKCTYLDNCLEFLQDLLYSKLDEEVRKEMS